MPESIADQGVSRVYIVRRGEFEIDAPSALVWPRLLDYGSWQNYSELQHVSGPVGGEGEVVLLKKDEIGYADVPPYYARTVSIEPGRRVIWKTFREGDDYFGIVEFSLDDLGSRTRFSYVNLYEHVLATTDPAEIAAFRRVREEALATLASVIFPRLKATVEADRRAAEAPHRSEPVIESEKQ